MLALAVVCLIVLLAAPPARADHDQEQHLAVGNVLPPPEPPKDWLGRTFPVIDEQRNKWPAFFRDTDLNVHFRSFYFNRQKSDGSASEAWALGGWLQYQSGWAFDTFAIGGVYYMSFPAYAPDSRPGTTLLTPGQDTIGTFGEAWGALRYKDYVLLKGGRERVDEGYVNSQDNRMVPNTFEAVTASGKVGWLRYDTGYLWTIKPRDSNDFISMSRQAGARGPNEGLILGALTLTPIQNLMIYAGTFYVPNVFNTVFTKTEYTHPFTESLAVTFGVQFTDQRAVGDERLGDFATWNVGAGARVQWKGLTVGLATHFTGDEASIRTPYGSWPGYLSLMVTDFDRANEKAWGIGVKYDFGGTLLPFKVPGLTVQVVYGQGIDREDPATGRGLATTREGNLDIIYNVPAVKGLSFRFRNAYGDDGGQRVFKDFRVIVNYEVSVF
ncbi:MAG TPA: OprD family outer membrane porin [Methylomirabilota bacterium]